MCVCVCVCVVCVGVCVNLEYELEGVGGAVTDPRVGSADPHKHWVTSTSVHCGRVRPGWYTCTHIHRERVDVYVWETEINKTLSGKRHAK